MYFLEKFCEEEELHKATHDYVTLCEAFQDYAVLMYILHSEALDFFFKKIHIHTEDSKNDKNITFINISEV